MHVFLIRHAIAVERSEDLPDEERPLTDEGRARFARAVKGLERLGVRFDVLRHSPWTRAVETADLLAPLVDGERVVDPGLARAPDAELIASLAGERVALVGHEPWMSEALGLLAFGEVEAGEPFAFKKGGVAWLRGRAKLRGMDLIAFLPPRVLRRL